MWYVVIFLGLEALMITARAVDRSADLQKVNEINKELFKVIKHFVDVKALRSVKNSGKHSLP